VTAPGQDSQEPERTAAAAAGQRGNRAYVALSPLHDGDAKPNGHEQRLGAPRTAVASSAAGSGPAHDFTESQQAGLAAVINLARSDVAIAPVGIEPTAPLADPRPSAGSPVADPPPVGTPFTPPAPVIAAPTVPAQGSAPDTSGAPVIPGLQRAERTPADRERRAMWSGTFAYVEFPLLMSILTAEALLTLRLVWSNSASPAEAMYLSAGHAELQGWLHGASIPAYASFFPGAPVIYPPIGAIADSAGGLVGARILSLIFMLGATAFLWGTTSKIFGRKAGVIAAALFAVLGPTLQLGALATGGALALLLMAASAWCLVASGDRDDSALLLIAGTALLAFANATAYSTLILDPSVIALAGLAVGQEEGAKAAVGRSGYVAAGVIGLISAMLAIGGPLYMVGALNVTASRAAVGQFSLLAVTGASKPVLLICVIAFAGVLFAILWRQARVRIVILCVLLVSGILVPLDQAGIHSARGSAAYVDFGAWFVAVAAGYALAQVSQIMRWRSLRFAVAGLVLLGAALPAGYMGRVQATRFFESWPNSVRLTAELLSLTRDHPGNYLAEGDAIPAYYLESSVSWQRWSDTGYFRYTPPGLRRPLTGVAAFEAAINRHYFALIILDFGETVQTDGEIIADIDQTGYYQVVKTVPTSAGRYTIWAYEEPKRAGTHRDRH
jgi:hypothetical protein